MAALFANLGRLSDALAFNWLGLRPGARLAEALRLFRRRGGGHHDRRVRFQSCLLKRGVP
jgi:hypothetical protein